MSKQSSDKQLLAKIDTYKSKSLSDIDMKALMGGRCNILVYGELQRVSDLNQILKPYDVCFILYEWYPGYGHWCALVRHKNTGGVEFFDPYGGFPDSQLSHVPADFVHESGQDDKYLSKLMLKYDGPLSYNEFKFQHKDKNISSCGRWCCLRAILKDVGLNEFKKLFFGKHSDEIATALTI